MPHIPSSDIHRLLILARMALGDSQEELAHRLGVSRRTVSRWEARERMPSLPQIGDIATAVHPTDSALAASLAAEAGTTLEALGVVPPPTPEPKPASSAAAPSPPPRPFPPVELLVDSILHAAMQAAQDQGAASGSLATVRSVLTAGFARAHALGLTAGEVHEVLSAAPAQRTPPHG